MEPTISIVIPTHDRGELLVDAVESSLAHSHAEVIVVDDRSADGSIERLARFGDQVKVIRGSYGNAAAARNAGVEAASGTYLAFLDSDDLMLQGKVTCLVQALDSDEEAALVHGTTEVIDATGQLQPLASEVQRRAFSVGARLGTTYGALAEFCAMFTSATLIRRSTFTAIGGYDETLDAYEDWDLYLRLSLVGRLRYADCLATRYRVWPGNVGWEATARWTAEVARRHLAALPPLSPTEHRRARYGFLCRLAESHHILVQSRAARLAAMKALLADPGRGLRNPRLARVLFASFVPARILRGRRPD